MLIKTFFIHLKVIALTAGKTVHSLQENKLGVLIPLFLGLIGTALVLFFIHSVSPLAPFVYSLF